MIRRFIALCLSLVCVLAVSACKGNDDPKTVDGFPAYITANNEKGAQDFARYWISTLNKATVTGKTDQLKKLNKPSCDTCADFAKQLDTIYAAGGHVETDGFQVKKIVNEANIPAPGAGVSVVLKSTPQKVYKSKGAAPRSLKGGDLRLRLILVRVKNHWVMDRIDIG